MINSYHSSCDPSDSRWTEFPSAWSVPVPFPLMLLCGVKTTVLHSWFWNHFQKALCLAGVETTSLIGWDWQHASSADQGCSWQLWMESSMKTLSQAMLCLLCDFVNIYSLHYKRSGLYGTFPPSCNFHFIELLTRPSTQIKFLPYTTDESYFIHLIWWCVILNGTSCTIPGLPCFLAVVKELDRGAGRGG